MYMMVIIRDASTSSFYFILTKHVTVYVSLVTRIFKIFFTGDGTSSQEYLVNFKQSSSNNFAIILKITIHYLVCTKLCNRMPSALPAINIISFLLSRRTSAPYKDNKKLLLFTL